VTHPRYGLQVHDGWQLFWHGWAAALTAVPGLPDDGSPGGRFAGAARPLRPAPADSGARSAAACLPRHDMGL